MGKNSYSSQIGKTTSIEIEKGMPIDYPGAFKMQLNENLNLGEYSIYILPPFSNFKDCIFLFPESTSKCISDNKVVSHDHNNFVFYKNKWHTPEAVFKKFPKNFTIFPETIINYCERHLRNKNYFKIPYKYFNQTSAEQIEFKQKAIQPVRNLFSKYGFLKQEGRGRGSDEEKRIRSIRRKTVVSAYRKAKRKKPTPIKFIQEQWQKKLEEMFPNDNKLYEKYLVADGTIRKDLKQEGLI